MTEILKFCQHCQEHPYLLLLVRVGITGLATLILYSLVEKIINLMIHIAKKKTSWTGDEELLAYVKKPIRILILLIGIFYCLAYLKDVLGPRYEHYLKGIFYVLIVWQIARTIMGLAGETGRLYLREIKDEPLLYGGKENFVPLITRLVKIIIFVIALIIILKHFGQDVQSLVVSLGVGSLAIALAAQETLSNMISGFVIMTDRPFRVGDRVKLDTGETGDIYQIGLRSTRILTLDNTLIIVPNALIVKEKLENLSYPAPDVRVEVTVGVSYDSDVHKVKAILLDICDKNPKILKEPAPNAYFKNFGDSSLDFFLACRVSNWKDEWTVAEEIRLEILRRFREEKIEIPFPQRTIWMVR
jgi:small-conductance mechanosensitive channel